MPDIDPNGLYTVEEVARFLMKARPDLSYEEALEEICEAITSGKLPVAARN